MLAGRGVEFPARLEAGAECPPTGPRRSQVQHGTPTEPSVPVARGGAIPAGRVAARLAAGTNASLQLTFELPQVRRNLAP